MALLGADRSVAREEMRELMEFETKLSKIMVPPQSRRNFSEIYNKLQLGELKVRDKHQGPLTYDKCISYGF